MAANRETYQEAIRLYVETSGDKELGALAAQLTKLGEGADSSAAQAEALVAELDKLATVGNNIRGFTTLKASIADTGEALAKAKTAASTLKAEFDAAETPTKKLAAAMVRADASVEKLTKQQNRQQAELGRTSGALRSAGVDTTNLAAAYDDLQGELGSLGERAATATNAMERAGKESKKAAAGIGLIERASAGAGKSLASIGARLTAVAAASTAALAAMAAAGTAALFTGAIRSAATLEDALAQVRAVSGATAEEMVALKEAAEAGGAATRFSTLEAAQGLGELARATGSAATAIALLTPALNLAQASGIGVSEAAVLMTTTLTQFGLGTDQAGRVADVMAKEVNTTTDSMQGLGDALKYSAPLAKQLGLDLEDTTAIIGALADESFRGEQAGTSLRNVFSEMLDPASNFASALREIGIESTDFATVIEQLAAKGDLGRAALLELDAAARPAITALVDKGGAKLRELEVSLRNAAGEAERTAAIMGKTLPGAFEAVQGAFDKVQRTLVEPLLEPLRDELTQLATELETLAKSPAFLELKGALKTLFSEGAEAARALIENIDFDRLAKDIRAFATDADGSLTRFKESLSGIVDTVVVVGRSFQLVFNAIQATVFGLVAVVAKLVEALLRVTAALPGPGQAILGFSGRLEETKAKLDEVAGGIGAVADEFRDRFTNNVNEAAAAAVALAAATEEAGPKVGVGLGKAAEASGKLAAASKDAAAGADAAKAALEGQAKGAVTTAKATTTAADQLAADADRLKKAFADMGIQSQQELGRAADSAKRNFDLIRQAVASGTASADDANRAFAAYAAAARAAVADGDDAARHRVENELEVQAAIAGTTAALKRMGNADDASKSKLKDNAKGAAVAILELGDAATGAAGGVKKTGDETEKAGENMRVGGKEGQKFALSLFEVSEKANEAYSAITRLQTGIGDSDGRFVRGMNDLTARIKNQGDAITAQVDALQAANAEFDELSGRRKELAQQYDLLGSGEVEKLLQAEVQLEANRKRAAEKRKSEAEQLAKVSAPTETGQVDVAGAAIAQREATAAVDTLLSKTTEAATALTQASTQLRPTGPLVIELRSVGGRNGVEFLTRADLDGLSREITNMVIRELELSSLSSSGRRR